eukprot:gene8557-11598_t
MSPRSPLHLQSRPPSARGRLWSAVGVALAAVGCAPPGPLTQEAAVEPLRRAVPVALSDLPALQLSVLQTAGPAARRLVLVHGTPGDATSWADYLAEPPADTQVIALDRPGFGHSGPEGAVTGLAEQAEAVA